MAESSSHNPSSPKITPKEEPVTLDKPESPNPFLPADQIEFTFEEIAFTTNNEVALLYPSHPNSKYFREVSDFISKCCLKEAFIRAPTQYKEYLSEFWYTAKTLDESKIWVSTPTGGIRGDMGINTFRNALRAHYLPHSSMYVSTPSITIVRPWFVTIGYSGEIRAKETLKKSCLPPSFFYLHYESASGHDASADSTAEVDPGLSALNDSISAQHDESEEEEEVAKDKDTHARRTQNVLFEKDDAKTNEEIKFRAIKLENLAKLVPNVKVDFKDLDSLEDDPIIVVDDSEEDEEEDKNEEIHSTTNDETEYILASTSPSQGYQLSENLKKSNLLPTELKDLPSKFNKLTKEVKGLKQQVHELDLELPGDLKDISSKLEDFTKAVASVQAKLKTIDAILGLLLNVTKALNKFTQVLDSALLKAGDQGVPSAGQADTMLAEEEKNTNQATIS
ncbi:hypothetical protein Tco_0568654 [Tanacetum coccineum]